jgi:chorismate mutase
MNKQDIDKWRIKIDEVDDKIVDLFNERAKYVLEIGKIKKDLNIPVYSPERENEIFRRVVNNNKGPLSDPAIRRLYERIIDESRRLEREKVISDK